MINFGFVRQQAATVITGILADPDYPACVGTVLLGSVVYGQGQVQFATVKNAQVTNGCTGSLTVIDTSQPLLGPDVPFVARLSGSLQCDCCGELVVNAQFTP